MDCESPDSLEKVATMRWSRERLPLASLSHASLETRGPASAREALGDVGGDVVRGHPLLHGGGGSDTITVSGRGQGPLVIYGDTSEDGLRYSNNTGAVQDIATAFPGNTGVRPNSVAPKQRN